MNVRMALWVVGIVVGAVALAQVPCVLLALFRGEAWLPFAAAVLLGASVSVLSALIARRESSVLDHRSAFIAVTLGWLSACMLGAAPFVWHPAVKLSLLDAFFESVSGFTTTGATVLSGLDRLPRSLLLWRSLTHWLGGMGMVLLGIAVLPVLGVGGMQLFKAESPGPTKDKLTPRIAETAKVLWLLYLGLTLSDVLLLMVGGMELFDAVCHAMATVSTGGFSTHDASLAYYDSAAITLVTAVFMLLGGSSFVVLHRGLTGGLHWGGNVELRTYVGIFIAASALIAIDLRLHQSGDYATLGVAAEHAIFQTASILTTTGFVTRDFALWPFLSSSLLLALCFVGGMAGSTGGGIKVIRIVLMVKLALSQFFRLVHPRGVLSLKLGDRTIEDQIVLSVLGFIAMWFLLLGLGTVLLALLGSDLLTAGSAAAVTLGNIGPGFGGVGPSNTFAGFDPGSKLLMSVLMLLGRLEVFAVLVIFTPGFWRQ